MSRSRAPGLLLVVVATLGLARCGGDAPPAHAPEAKHPEGARAQDPTSVDLLVKAEKAGEIDHDTRLELTLYAALDPAKLPEKYRARHAPMELTSLLFEINARRSSMTPERAARMAPFFLPPTDPGSFWAAVAPAPAQPTERRAGSKAKEGAVSVKWVSTLLAAQKIRLWRPELQYEDQPAVDELAAAIPQSDMVAKEEKIVQEPLCVTGNSMDVYVSLFSPDREKQIPSYASGITVPFSTTTSFILIDPHAASLKITMAHELFHAYQNCVCKTDCGANWWKEATAVWAAEQVFPTASDSGSDTPRNDSEWGRLRASSLWSNHEASDAGPSYQDGPLDFYVDGREYQYSSYLFFFWLTTYGGQDPTWVGSFVKSSQPAVQRVTALPGWKRLFSDFALRNWNKYPVPDFVDHGAPIPQSFLTQSTAPSFHVDNGKADQPMAVHVPHLSVAYYRVDVADFVKGSGGSFVKELHIDPSGLAKNANAGVQAILDFGARGKRVVDMNDLKEVVYCRAKDEEHLESAVLVVSNADPTKDLDAEIHFRPKNACDLDTGNFTYDGSESGREHIAIPTTTSDRSFDWHEHMTSKWKVELSMRNDPFVYYDIVESTDSITVSGTDSMQATGTLGSATSRLTASAGGTATSPKPGVAGRITVKKKPDGSADWSIQWSGSRVPATYTYQKHAESACIGQGSKETQDEEYVPGRNVIAVRRSPCRGNPQSVEQHASYRGYACLPGIDGLYDAMHGTLAAGSAHISGQAQRTTQKCGEAIGCAADQGIYHSMYTQGCTTSFSARVDLTLPAPP